MVVLTGLTVAFDRMRQLAAYARTKNRRVIVVAGGPAVRALPRLARQYFDYACVGDIEELQEVVSDAFGSEYVAKEMFPRFDLTSGIARIFQGLSEFSEQTAGVGLPWALAIPIEIFALIGQSNEGLEWLSKAKVAVDKNDESHWLAELERLKGELLLAQSVENADDAERSFYQAIDIARTQDAKSLELRASMSLARLLQQKKQLSEARSCLSEIYEWFTEGFETKDLLEARALLDSLC